MGETIKINQLNLGYTDELLQIRHLHTWQEPLSAHAVVHHLLLDKQGILIVATSDVVAGQLGQPVLRPGEIYIISSFFVTPARMMDRCCSNNFELRFMNNTSFRSVPEPPPSDYHPTNMAEPVPFFDLYVRALANKERSDIMGRIVAISKPYMDTSGDGMAMHQLMILEDDCNRQILTQIVDHSIIHSLEALVVTQERNGPVIATMTYMVGHCSDGKKIYKNTCSTRVIVDQSLRMHRPIFYRHSSSNMPIFYINQWRANDLIKPIQKHGPCHSIADLLFLLAEDDALNTTPSISATFKCLATVQKINHQFGFFTWLCPECSPQKHKLFPNDVCSNCSASIAHDERIKSFYISADVCDETFKTAFLVSHEAAAALLQTYPLWDLEDADVRHLLQPIVHRTYTFEVRMLPWCKDSHERFEVVAVWHRHAAGVQD